MSLADLELFQMQAKASGVIFHHSGELNEAVIAAAAQALRRRMDEAGASGPAKRKLFSTFVEMAQNIVHYAALPPGTHADTTRGKDGTVAVGKSVDDYWVVCVNRVDAAHIARLTEKLDAVRSMSLEEIRARYREQLHKNPLEPADPVSKGAGLGWLTIARDSKQPLEYRFASAPEAGGTTAFFLAKVVV